MRRAAVILLGIVAATVFAACGGGGTTVDVVLSEWIVNPAVDEAPAGDVTFAAENAGAEDHELVIVRGDDPAALPVDDTGKVDEDALAEGAFIGEIEEFESGSTEEASFDLEAGTYILFCNIVEEEDDGSFESHFQEGMVTTIEITE
jgi:hypothetical protein